MLRGSGALGQHLLRLQKCSYETFEIVSFAGNELFAHDVYAIYKLRTQFSCAMFFVKSAQALSRSAALNVLPLFMFLVCGKSSYKH